MSDFSFLNVCETLEEKITENAAISCRSYQIKEAQSSTNLHYYDTSVVCGSFSHCNGFCLLLQKH